MRIKADHVTNSSTTSFVVMAIGDLNKADLADLMGVPSGSHLQPLVDGLYEALKRNMVPVVDSNATSDGSALSEAYRDRIPDEVLAKVSAAFEHGWKVWAGRMRSDWDATELLFCCESFEWKNDRMYINGLECSW